MAARPSTASKWTAVNDAAAGGMPPLMSAAVGFVQRVSRDVAAGGWHAAAAAAAVVTLLLLLVLACYYCCCKRKPKVVHASASLVLPADEDLVRLRHRYESRLAQAEQAGLLEAAIDG